MIGGPGCRENPGHADRNPVNTPADLRHASRLEQAWRQHPQRFTRGTALLAAALLAGLGLALLLPAAGQLWAIGRWVAGGSALWGLLALPCGAALWLGAAAWLPLAPPAEGIPVAANEHPRLAELLRRLDSALGSRARPDLCLTDQPGLHLSPGTRWGLLGGGRPRLSVGLPLLMGLDGPQAAALLAREVALGQERSLAAWVCRWHARWQAVLQARLPAAPGPRATGWLLWVFAGGVRPFQARAQVLARSQGLAADAWAARWTGPTGAELLAQGLLAQAVLARFLQQQFWPQVWASTPTERRPTAQPMRDLRVLLRQALQHPDAPHWLQEALRTPARPGAGQASLRERLEALTEALPTPTPPRAAAAEVLLGAALPAAITALDAAWQQRVADDWLARHQTHRLQTQWLTALDTAAPTAEHGRLPRAEALWQGRLTQALRAPADSAARWREVIAQHAAPAEARLGLARALLAGEPPLQPPGRQPALHPAQAEALALLQALTDEGRASASYAETLAADPRWRVPAARLLVQQLALREDFPRLQAARSRLHALEDEARHALALLRDFDGEQTLRPADLPASVLQPVQALLQGEHAVGRAWLWRKTSTQAKGWALHLLVIERARTLVQPEPQGWGAALAPRLAQALPLDWWVVDLAHPDWKALNRRDLVQQFRANDATLIHTGLARRPAGRA